VIEELRQTYELKALLDFADLARSTYYYQRKLLHQTDKHAKHRLEISAMYKKHHGWYGYRRITLALQNQGIQLNHKTVLKLMNSLGLHGKVKHRAYKSYKGQTGRVASNHLNRVFHSDEPLKKMVTDVTEFPLPKEKLYLSPIQDLFNGEIISYSISPRPVYAQIDEMLKQLELEYEKNSEVLLHSDQGWQYQCNYYQYTLKRMGITQSMSRKGNCLDNSPMESFFGRLKTELFYGNEKSFSNYNKLKRAIEEYITYYNNDRIKEKLGGLSPVQYRIQALE